MLRTRGVTPAFPNTPSFCVNKHRDNFTLTWPINLCLAVRFTYDFQLYRRIKWKDEHLSRIGTYFEENDGGLFKDAKIDIFLE
jgi:hypothetical protein